MIYDDLIESKDVAVLDESAREDDLELSQTVVDVRAFRPPHPTLSAVIGELIGFKDEGRTPLVIYPGQPGFAALAARSVVDLHGPHVGHEVVLTFDRTDPMKPIVIGVLRAGEGWPLAGPPGQVQVDADGERLIVSAKEQLVLRCGKARITLTRAGKVLIEGTYVLTRSSGANRIKGGTVQIN